MILLIKKKVIIFYLVETKVGLFMIITKFLKNGKKDIVVKSYRKYLIVETKQLHLL